MFSETFQKTFQVIEHDDAIENFGLTARIDDSQPLVQVSRDDFPKLSSLRAAVRAAGERP